MGLSKVVHMLIITVLKTVTSGSNVHSRFVVAEGVHSVNDITNGAIATKRACGFIPTVAFGGWWDDIAYRLGRCVINGLGMTLIREYSIFGCLRAAAERFR